MSFSTFLVRSVGVGATALTLREINLKSKEHAAFETREEVAENLTDLLIKHTVNGDGTELTEKMKEKYFEWRMDDNNVSYLQYFKNRIGGLGHAFVEHIVGLGLSVAAICTYSSSKNRFYKGFVPKPVAVGCLALMGIFAATGFTRNVLGWGSNHPKGFYP